MSKTNKVDKFISGLERFNKGVADAMTMGMTDFDKRGDSPFQQDFKRGVAGFADSMTGGLTDFSGKVDSSFQASNRERMNQILNYFAGGTPMSEAEARERFPGSFPDYPAPELRRPDMQQGLDDLAPNPNDSEVQRLLDMKMMNGETDSNGGNSLGDSQAQQRMMKNEETSLSNKADRLLKMLMGG